MVYLNGQEACLRQHSNDWVEMAGFDHSRLRGRVSFAETVHCFDADQNQLFYLLSTSSSANRQTTTTNSYFNDIVYK